MSATAGVSMFEEAQLAKLHTGTGVHSTHSVTASSGHSSQSFAKQQLLHAEFQQQGREKIMAAHTVQDTFAGDLSCPVQQGNALSTGPMALYQAGRESGHYRSDRRQRLTVSMLQVRCDREHDMISAPRSVIFTHLLDPQVFGAAQSREPTAYSHSTVFTM